MDELQEFLDELTVEFRELYIRASHCFWDAEISGSEDDFKKRGVADLALAVFFSNKMRFEKLRAYKEDKISDLLLARQVEVFFRGFLSKQGDKALLAKITELEVKAGKKFNTYRAEIDGKTYTDNELKNILRTSTDAGLLQKVWESNKRQGVLVEKDIIALVKLRNELAKNLGFDNFYEFSLRCDEQSADEIFSIFEKLANETDAPFAKLKSELDAHLATRLAVDKKNLKPWHYQDFFFQEAIPLGEINFDKNYADKDVLVIGKDFYKRLGLPVDEIIARSSMYEQPGKCQHAFTEDLDREGDVRTLNNLKNNNQWMETLLHELGHCVYKEYMNKSIPYVLRDAAHTFTTEAVAMLMGRLPMNKKFIEHYLHKPGAAMVESIQKGAVQSMLIPARWTQVMVHFERELYANPDQDLNGLWWSLVKRYQGIDFSRDAPDWASKIHFVIAPVYYHNYLLGELLASQFNATIAKQQGVDIAEVEYIDRKDVGEFFKDKVFNIANTQHWDEMINGATGEKLNPEHFVNQFCK